MNLTGKELVSKGIITGTIPEENIQQHGVDLNLIKVEMIHGEVDMGFIPKVGKTILAARTIMLPYQSVKYGDKIIWSLPPGIYDITFEQGCSVPPDQRLEIVQRSSLLRNGSVLRSSVFDAGFWTANIGTCIVLHQPLAIEVGARVAQIIAVASNTVENLYTGQWQGDQQRVFDNKPAA